MIRSKTRQRSHQRIFVRASFLLFCLAFFAWPVLSDKIEELHAPMPSLTVLAQKQVETDILEVSKASSNGTDPLILVNKYHPLSSDYVPSDLKKVNATTASAVDHKLAAEAATAFDQLSAAAKKEECTIKLVSGYRSYETQQNLFNTYVARDGNYTAAQYSAEPGYSEHQTGLAADVSSPSIEYDLIEAYGNTKEGLWLAKNAHKFGYIIRYQEDTQHITGYIYEPWHIRYVGKEAATEIHERNITLEEYLGQY